MEAQEQSCRKLWDKANHNEKYLAIDAK